MFLYTKTNPISQFLNKAPVNDDVLTAEQTAIGYILNWTRILGTGLALIMLTILSVQFMSTRHGNPGKGADAKMKLQNFAIGAVVFIGATNILYYVEQFLEAILTDIT